MIPIEFDAVKLMRKMDVEISIINADVVEFRLKLARIFIWLAMRIAGVGGIKFVTGE